MAPTSTPTRPEDLRAVLRSALEAGENSGEAEPFDVDAFIAGKIAETDSDPGGGRKPSLHL